MRAGFDFARHTTSGWLCANLVIDSRISMKDFHILLNSSRIFEVISLYLSDHPGIRVWASGSGSPKALIDEREAAMEPLSALGFASNIAQFLQFGGSLISGSVEFYRSMDGVSSVNNELQYLTDDLTTVCRALSTPEGYNHGSRGTEPELALIPLAQSCRALGDEFLSVLRTLKVDPRRKRFDSVRQALRNQWKKTQLQDYRERLEGFRSQMMLHLMQLLR